MASYKLKMRVVFLLIPIWLLAITGCMGPLAQIEDTDPRVREQVTVYEDKSILQSDEAQVLGAVEATSCKNLLWQPDASIENCIDQLTMKAARLGGNGIVVGGFEKRNADFVGKRGINRNCWNTVDCSAVVIRKK